MLDRGGEKEEDTGVGWSVNTDLYSVVLVVSLKPCAVGSL